MDDWRPTRTALAYALFFSLPVGIGVAGAMMRGTGRVFSPLVVGSSLVASLFVFLLVLVGATVGSPTIDP